MKIEAIYADSNGETHYGHIDKDFKDFGDIGQIAEVDAANAIFFRHTTPEYSYEWHNTPRYQYVINLKGGVSITVSDGTTKTFYQGDVFLLLDTVGKGHFSKSLGEERFSVFIAITEETAKKLLAKLLKN